MNLDERWKQFTMWWGRMETNTQLLLERLVDSGHSFTVLVSVFIAVAVFCIWMAT